MKLTLKLSHLVEQERDMVRQCLGLLCVEWTGWMRVHWLAEVEPQTSLQGGQWLQLLRTEAEMRGMSG